MLRFENVGMRYGIGPEILRDINFALEPGSLHFLTGPSGAGKTTLLKLMYLALRPTRGLVHLLGHDISLTPRSELPELRRQIGVVFQEFRLIDHLSAVENVALPLRVANIKQSTIDSHVRELLSWVGLGDHLNAKPPTLSGGQQQRVAIARAFISDPKVLLCDEPTGDLDRKTAEEILKILQLLAKDFGKTVIIVTHDPEAAKFADRQLHLDKGKFFERKAA